MKKTLVLIAAGFSFVAPAFAETPDARPGGDAGWRNEKAQGSVPDGIAAGKDNSSDLIKPLNEVWRLVFHNARGQDVVLDCEVARTEKDKERGLMFRKNLAKNRGMIFVYKKPEEMNFWMRNTVIPLSIAYVHEKLFISSIHDLKPLNLDVVGSEIAVLYAVEANQGWFKHNAILSGNKMTIYKNPDDYKVRVKNKYRKEIPTP